MRYDTVSSTPSALTPALEWMPSDAPRDQPQPADQPHVFDKRFRVLGPIGRGGMGKVQLCEDLSLRSEAAVKVLRSEGTDMRRRFRDEAILLANLRHPHLVQVLAVGETEEGFPYIAMEHLGQSLDRRLRREKTLPWREAVEIGVQIAEALSTLHRAGVVHRDVKPANIAELRGVTGRVFVKLIDLGVARVENLSSLQQGGESAPPRRRTKEGKILGTPGYTPPRRACVSRTPASTSTGSARPSLSCAPEWSPTRSSARRCAPSSPSSICRRSLILSSPTRSRSYPNRGSRLRPSCQRVSRLSSIATPKGQRLRSLMGATS